MAHAWNACWVNRPQGFKSPILRRPGPRVCPTQTRGLPAAGATPAMAADAAHDGCPTLVTRFTATAITTVPNRYDISA